MKKIYSALLLLAIAAPANAAFVDSHYAGDIAAGAIIDVKFNSFNDSNALATLAGTPAIKVYKNNDTTTEVTTGVTISADFDSITGLNNLRIDTSQDGTFYAAGNNFTAVVTTGTVGGTSVVGQTVASFSIANRPVQGLAANVITATSIASDAITAAKVANGTIDEATFAADTAKYQAKVWFFIDTGGTADRYVVAWFKDGEPITAGITSPTIQVFKATDGTDLIASTAMTQIASTGTYRYVEATNRVASGAAYIAKVTASINSGTRTWLQPVGTNN